MTNIIGKMEDLQKSVNNATLEEINQTRGQALQQAQKIKDDAQSKADSILAEQKKDAENAAEEHREQILAETRRQTIEKRLSAREDALNQVWKSAEKQLHEIVGSDSYNQVLKQLAFLAARMIGPGEIQLASDSTGQKLLTDDTLGKWSKEVSKTDGLEITFTPADQKIESWGGLLATNQAAKKRLDARFEQRLENAKRDLRDEIFAEMMGHT
jgi:vacuolar-type H+-ATPase subunit E/Vma4